MKASEVKPYMLAKWNSPNSTRPRLVQIISHAIPPESVNGETTVVVRMVPGDPTTIEDVPITSLIPSKGMGWLHVARVNSTFSFPEDMLRYDCAYLYDHTVEESSVPRETRHDVLIYRMTSSKTPNWTNSRWHSFSCSINPILAKDIRNENEIR